MSSALTVYSWPLIVTTISLAVVSLSTIKVPVKVTVPLDSSALTMSSSVTSSKYIAAVIVVSKTAVLVTLPSLPAASTTVIETVNEPSTKPAKSSPSTDTLPSLSTDIAEAGTDNVLAGSALSVITIPTTVAPNSTLPVKSVEPLSVLFK